MYELLEGPRRKKTWLESLPQETTQLVIGHINDLFTNYYSKEIKGALSQVGAAYASTKFLAAERVKVKFSATFEILYQKLTLKKDMKSKQDEEEETPPGKSDETPAKPAQDQPESPEEQMKTFKRNMELQCSEQLDEKLIVMTLDGCHGELQSNILATELYKNLTEEGCRFVGMYDSKKCETLRTLRRRSYQCSRARAR
jgi:hypothetical protein